MKQKAQNKHIYKKKNQNNNNSKQTKNNKPFPKKYSYRKPSNSTHATSITCEIICE